jgi:hypothetical protein
LSNFISDEDVEKALDYLRDDADASAKAKAERIYVEEYLRVIKAQVMKEYPDLSVAAQEREAYSDERYLRHLDAIREAVELDEKHRFLREGARAKIEAFQTLSANYRSMKL